MMVNTRFSKDDEELLESNFFRTSHLTSTDSNSNMTTPHNMFYSRTSRTNTLYSSPLTDGEERSRSSSVPISPLHHEHHGREDVEIAQLELELQFKTLEMLALIKGTTPRAAFEAEREEEIRSQQRSRSHVETEDEDLDLHEVLLMNEQQQHQQHLLLIKPPSIIANDANSSEAEDDGEYLVGFSYIDEEHPPSAEEILLHESDDEEEDIFGMEL